MDKKEIIEHALLVESFPSRVRGDYTTILGNLTLKFDGPHQLELDFDEGIDEAKEED